MRFPNGRLILCATRLLFLDFTVHLNIMPCLHQHISLKFYGMADSIAYVVETWPSKTWTQSDWDKMWTCCEFAYREASGHCMHRIPFRELSQSLPPLLSLLEACRISIENESSEFSSGTSSFARCDWLTQMPARVATRPAARLVSSWNLTQHRNKLAFSISLTSTWTELATGKAVAFISQLVLKVQLLEIEATMSNLLLNVSKAQQSWCVN